MYANQSKLGTKTNSHIALRFDEYAMSMYWMLDRELVCRELTRGFKCHCRTTTSTPQNHLRDGTRTLEPYGPHNVTTSWLATWLATTSSV